MTAPLNRLCIIIPVHNEADIVASSVTKLAAWSGLRRFRTVDLFLIENGSMDSSAREAQQLARDFPWPFEGGRIFAFSEPQAGIGHAYFRGAQEVLARPDVDENDWLLWTACDLPFADSDLRAFLEYIDTGGRGGIVIGSKAHRMSKVKRGLKRSLMGLVFRAARWIFLRLRTGDTQGTFFVRGDVVHNIVGAVRARDFFFTTEFCYRCNRAGLPIVEVPVELQPEVRPSTVHPLRDGLRVMKATISMRAKYS